MMIRTFLAGVIAAALLAGQAAAAVVVNAWEAGGNLEFQASGSLDLTGLTLSSTTGIAPGVNPTLAVISFGDGDKIDFHTSAAIAGPASFGAGGPQSAVKVAGGDDFYLYFDNKVVGVSPGYASGDPIFTAMAILGQSIATMGMNPGSHVWTLPNDTVTLKVGVAPAVPLPASLPLLAAGFGALAWRGRRKRG